MKVDIPNPVTLFATVTLLVCVCFFQGTVLFCDLSLSHSQRIRYVSIRVIALWFSYVTVALTYFCTSFLFVFVCVVLSVISTVRC